MTARLGGYKLIQTVVGILGIVGLGLSLSQGASSWRLDPPSVHVQVERGKILEYRVQIANPGATELRVTDAVPESPYVSARVETPRISPGGFGGVFLRVETASLPEEFEERIEIRTDDAVAPTRTFVLTGRKVDPLPPPPPDNATVPGANPATAGSPTPGAALPGGTSPGSNPAAPSSPSRKSSSTASPLLAIVLAGAAGLVLAFALWRRRKAT